MQVRERSIKLSARIKDKRSFFYPLDVIFTYFFFFWSRALYGRYLISYRVKTALYTELLRYYIQVFGSIKELVLRKKLSASPITIYSSKIACLVYMAFRISCLDPSWNGNAWKTYRGWKLCPVSPLPLWRVLRMFTVLHKLAYYGTY